MRWLQRLLLAAVNRTSPEQQVLTVAALRPQLDRVERRAVARLRGQGASWADIGHLLGTSRQAAHKRFR